MTCVVGFVSGGTVYIGADSLATCDDQVSVQSGAKVFRNGEFLIGLGGTPRMLQVAQYIFRPPPIEGDLLAYMVTHFVNALHEAARQGGYARTDDGADVIQDTMLIGVRGRLFKVESNYSVVEAACQYQAIGSGTLAACGAMYAMAVEGTLPESRVALALAAAQEHCRGVRGPFVVLSTAESFPLLPE